MFKHRVANYFRDTLPRRKSLEHELQAAQEQRDLEAQVQPILPAPVQPTTQAFVAPLSMPKTPPKAVRTRQKKG